MSSPAVLITRLPDHVTLVTINRPEARNAVNGDVATGLDAAITETEADPDTWVVILTGAGQRRLQRRCRPEGRVQRQRPCTAHRSAAVLPALCRPRAPSPGSPPSTARPWPAAANWRWPATCGWPCRRRASACPRSSAA